MYILDTHTFLWFITDSKELPEHIKELICREKNICISIASLWEIEIKKSIGKLKFNYTSSQIEKYCYDNDILILPILPKDLDQIGALENIHGDPFDRILICQAITSMATIITKDGIIPKYPVKVLW